jgi:hypothetical protein
MMFDELTPISINATPYGTVEELLAVDDLVEQDVTIRRWSVGGRSLKLRLKALNLEQQDAIHQAALVKNPKTGLWEEHRPTFCTESLMRLVRVPALDIGQARTLVKKNPTVINALVDFGWALSALDTAALEAAALALAPQPDADTTATTDDRPVAGADDGGLAAADS